MKIFTTCLKESTPPIKNGPNPLWLVPHNDDKYKNENYDQTTYSFPLLLVPPGKPVHQAIHHPMANFGPLFDHHFTPRSPEAW